DGLVEQQESRLRRQRHRDLELTLLAVGEIGGRDLAARAEPHRLERLLRRLAKRAFLAGRAPESEAGAAMGLDGEGRVVEGRQLGKDARDLKRSGQAEPRP